MRIWNAPSALGSASFRHSRYAWNALAESSAGALIMIRPVCHEQSCGRRWWNSRSTDVLVEGRTRANFLPLVRTALIDGSLVARYRITAA